MAPRPIIIFDTVPRVRVSGQFKLGVVSYFADQIGGLSGVVLTATDGTSTVTQTKNLNTLRTEFYDVGTHNGTSYSTYNGYSAVRRLPRDPRRRPAREVAAGRCRRLAAAGLCQPGDMSLTYTLQDS